MKVRKKSILAIILSIVMLLGIFPVNANESEPNNQKHSIFDNYSIYENRYLITLTIQNFVDKTIKDINIIETRTVAFRDSTKKYMNNKNVINAIKKEIINRKDKNWETEFYIIETVSGPYNASVSALADKFYREEKISEFYAVIPKATNAKKLSLLNKAYNDDMIDYFFIVLNCSDKLNYDELADKAYEDDKVNFFFVILPYVSESKSRELVEKATKDKKNNYLLVLGEELIIDVNSKVNSRFGIYDNNYIITGMWHNHRSTLTDDMKTIEIKLDKTYTVAFAKEVQSYMTEQKVIDAVTKKIQEMKSEDNRYYGKPTNWENEIFIITKILGPTKESADLLAAKFYESKDLEMFELIIGHASDKAKAAHLERAYEDKRTGYFTIIMEVTDGIDYDKWAEKAYNDRRTAIFSILLPNISESKKTELFEKATIDNAKAYLDILKP